MEEHAGDVRPHKREAQLDAVHQQRVAADRKAGDRIARPRLVHPEAALGVAAAGEEPLGQRQIAGEHGGLPPVGLKHLDGARRAERFGHAELRVPRQHPGAMDGVVGGELQDGAHKGGLAAHLPRRDPAVEGQEHAAVRLGRVVPPVANEGGAQHAHARGP